MKTYSARKEDVQRDWYVVDAEGKVLGRLACEIASRLRGKHKPVYTPHVDTGDFIIVVNAEKVVLTGRKLTDKMYYSHSGYPGGLKSITAENLLQTGRKRCSALPSRVCFRRTPWEGRCSGSSRSTRAARMGTKPRAPGRSSCRLSQGRFDLERNMEKRFYATGKRKTAIARVYMKEGSGQLIINKRNFDDYFTRTA